MTRTVTLLATVLFAAATGCASPTDTEETKAPPADEPAQAAEEEKAEVTVDTARPANGTSEYCCKDRPPSH